MTFDKKKILFRSSKEIFLPIILIALIFRIDVHTVERYCDEEAYDWLAYNLSQGKLRTGSTFTSVYAQFGAAIPDDGVEPWLDHPVLYPLILGAVKKLPQFFNAEVKFYDVRLASILIFCLPTIYLAMVICRKEFGAGAAAISGLTYALVPSMVLQQKMIFLDHGVAFFSMLSIYALSVHLSSGTERWWILSVIFSGLASLSKGLGIFAILAVALTMVLKPQSTLKKRTIRSFLSLVIGGSLFLLYPIYAYVLNFQLFKAIASVQLSRASPEWLVRSMFEYPWSYQHVYDYFLLLGWISVAYTVVIGSREKRINPTLMWLICYLAVLVFVAKTAYYYSQILFYPFLSILTGKMLFDIIRFLCSLKGRSQSQEHNDEEATPWLYFTLYSILLIIIRKIRGACPRFILSTR